MSSLFPILAFIVISFLFMGGATRNITFGLFDKKGKKPMTRGDQLVDWEKKTAAKTAKRAASLATKGGVRILKKIFK